MALDMKRATYMCRNGSSPEQTQVSDKYKNIEKESLKATVTKEELYAFS